MIVDNGSCSVSAGPMDFVIQADIAKIENDTLILKRDGAGAEPCAEAPAAAASSTSARHRGRPSLRPGAALSGQ